MHLELPILSFLSALLSLAPLPWHLRAGTIPTVSIALWLFISNIINGVNSIVWAGNVDIISPVWCDICTKIIMGANVALPSSIFALCLHLERVSSVRQMSTSHAERRKRQYLDVFLCFGIPAIYMALHYVVQGHRFDIIEDFGCRVTTYVSLASVFIIWIPPLTFSVGAFVLSAVAFRNFWIRRITFARHLQSKSALTPSRYFRLMAMSLVQMFWGLLVTIFDMWFTMRGGLRPWISWQNVHFNFSRIALFPTIFIPAQDLLFTYLLFWTVPISTFLFFMFFAFGQDAVKEYLAFCHWVKRTVIRLPLPMPKSQIKTILPKSAQVNNAIGLKPLDNVKREVDDWTPEHSFASPSPLPLKGYRWDPPFSSDTSTICPPYYPSSPTEIMSKSAYEDSDRQSEITQCATPIYKAPKAVGSYSDLSLCAPSLAPGYSHTGEPVPELPEQWPSPLSPPPSHYRLRALLLQPPDASPQRPLTYPSCDASPLIVPPNTSA